VIPQVRMPELAISYTREKEEQTADWDRRSEDVRTGMASERVQRDTLVPKLAFYVRLSKSFLWVLVASRNANRGTYAFVP